MKKTDDPHWVHYTCDRLTHCTHPVTLKWNRILICFINSIYVYLRYLDNAWFIQFGREHGKVKCIQMWDLGRWNWSVDQPHVLTLHRNTVLSKGNNNTGGKHMVINLGVQQGGATINGNHWASNELRGFPAESKCTLSSEGLITAMR